VHATFGDASRPEVLEAAGIERASAVVVTTASLSAKMAIALALRRRHPDMPLIMAAADEGDRAWLAEFGVDEPCNITAPAVDALEQALERAAR
jgi:CPA2 family monovalent cation:H+ antiporter-2